jgi:Flp pilus assembly protein TadG
MRRLWQESSGAAALEFGLLAPAFLFIILAIFELGTVLTIQNDLDNATQNAARKVMTGVVQSSATQPTADQFKTNYVCNSLPSNMCNSSGNNVVVSVQSFQETNNQFYTYVNSTNSGLIPLNVSAVQPYCIGAPSSYVYLQVAYPQPLITSILSSASDFIFNGKSTRLITSRAVFRNEPFTAQNFVLAAGCNS